MTRQLLVRILAIIGVILAAIAFLSAIVSGFSAPGWVLPAAVLCVCAAVALVT